MLYQTILHKRNSLWTFYLIFWLYTQNSAQHLSSDLWTKIEAYAKILYLPNQLSNKIAEFKSVRKREFYTLWHLIFCIPFENQVSLWKILSVNGE